MKVPSHILEKFIQTRFCKSYPEHFTEVNCTITENFENRLIYEIKIHLKKFDNITLKIDGRSYFNLKIEIGRKLKTHFNLHRSELEIYFIYNIPNQIYII